MGNTIKWYAEHKTAHKGSARTGTLLAVLEGVTNKLAVRAFAVPAGEHDPFRALPVLTWVHPSHFRKCEEVSEAAAREINARMVDFVATFPDRDAMWRVSYHLEAKRSPIANDAQVRGNSGETFRRLYGR